MNVVNVSRVYAALVACLAGSLGSWIARDLDPSPVMHHLEFREFVLGRTPAEISARFSGNVLRTQGKKISYWAVSYDRADGRGDLETVVAFDDRWRAMDVEFVHSRRKHSVSGRGLDPAVSERSP